jgi:staphylococcal nuclease domain-containing protein 1
VQGRKLVANVDQREGNLLHLRLIDPSDPNAADDPLACLNADLVREGESSRVESYIGFEFERIMYG